MESILLHPNPGLKTICQSVRALNLREIKRVVNMLELIKEEAHKGIGLAAPQIAWNARLFVMNVEETPQDERVYVNPEIIWTSQQETAAVEGCLSVPGQDFVVVRPAFIRAKAAVISGVNLREIAARGAELEIDTASVVQEFRLSGLKARCWQHEFDHLQGLTIVETGKPFKNETQN